MSEFLHAALPWIALGMGVAVAILEELRRRGCMYLVTTHYPQVKRWAEETPGVVPARMAFDRATLRPLYRLEMGRSGESCALDIARRLGLAPALLHRARLAAYGSAPGEEPPALAIPRSRLKRTVVRTAGALPAFSMGDSVMLLPERVKGIVYRSADDNGDLVVQVQGEKRTVRHTRVQLLVPAAELYPEDYDFSIIFDTVANRKAAHTMARKFDAEAVIIHREGRPEGQ